MNRTNLVLCLLEEASRLSYEEIYSQAVERAVEEFVRQKGRRILELRRSGAWEKDLSEMRRNRKPRGGDS